MIIQSKFHDYYDPFLKAGMRDPKTVYARESVNEWVGGIPRHRLGRFDRSISCLGGGESRYCNLVLLCGKIYPFSFVAPEISRETFPEENRANFDYENPYAGFPVLKHFVNAPEQASFGQPDDEAMELNRKYAPVIYLGRGLSHSGFLYPGVVLNPRLKDLFFPMNGGEVVQTIMSFLSSQDPKIVEVADSYRITEHGFDSASFRCEKGGPTRKRKRLAAV